MSISLLRNPFGHQLKHVCACSSRCSSTRQFRSSATAAIAQSRLASSEVDEAGPSTGEAPEDVAETQPKSRAQKRKARQRLPMNLLERTKVEEHLEAIKATSSAPLTIEDLERYRPETPGDPDLPQYEADYKNLVNTLCNSFNRAQLRAFGQLYGLEPRFISSKRTKDQYARAIAEQRWGWVSLAEVQKRKEAWMPTTQSFPLDPRQSFLILGKDGSDLLELSAKYDVHITLSSNPLSLKVTGLKSSLEKLGRYMRSMKKDIQQTIFDIPSGKSLSSDLLQRVSRLAGAFVENFGGGGQLRISARDVRALSLARRLALRGASETETPEACPTFSYLPSGIASDSAVPVSLFPYTYSVFPFLTSRPLPWSLASNATFRIRRVGEWIGVDNSEDISKTGGLAGDQGRILTAKGDEVSLRDSLASSLETSEDVSLMQRQFRATLGHGLAMSASGGKANIVPPLKGNWQYSKILDWIQTHNVKQVFIPSMPPAFFGSPPANQKILHRVVYHSTTHPETHPLLPSPRKLLKFEVVLEHVTDNSPVRSNPSQPDDEKPIVDVDLNTGVGSSTDIQVERDRDLWSEQTSEITPEPEDIAPAERRDDDVDLNPVGTESENESTTVETPAPNETAATKQPKLNLSSQCIGGLESSLDVLMPDRPMDIRFSASHTAVIPEDRWPTDLQAYFTKLRSFLSYEDQEGEQPDSPFSFEYDGETYMLQSSMSVRQSTQEGQLAFGKEEPSSEANSSSIQIITESILDLESDEKSTTCQVICSDTESTEAWKDFLTSCDKLTAAPPKKQLQPMDESDL
ncbi:hypothetical protein HGRIS_007794 [Hohenbuehelia grisea]|uniref:Uncharacterized protein n=1 Tax=Hohenbuehelia grisea TaxID=104357 RepID=A0ABR3J7B9_9AGAR